MGFQMTSKAQSSDSLQLRSSILGGFSAKAAHHINKVKNSALLIRLSDERKRIAYMEKMGKAEQAQTLRNQTKEANEEMIAAFKKYYTFCPVYFYYSSEADAVLKEKKFDLLWLDIDKKADNISFSETPYILMYGPLAHLRWNDQYKFVLYEWDYDNIHPTSVAYPTIRMRKMKRLITKDNPSLDITLLSDMEILVMGLNSTYETHW